MSLGTATVRAKAGFSPTDILGVVRVSFAGDNSYPIGGYPAFSDYMKEALERGVIVQAVTGFGDKSGTAYHVEYDVVEDTLKVRAGATGIELTDTADINDVTFELTVFCK